MRYKATLSYRGTAFYGWQIQKPASTWRGALPRDGFLRTVQGELGKALRSVLGHPVNVVGASRTDSGVHAKGQVAHFDTHLEQIPRDGLRRAINARLPEDVVVTRLEPTFPTFDAIFDALYKRYQYLVWTGIDRNVFKENLSFHRWKPVDAEAMRAAAPHLVGTHDFTSFCRPGHGRYSTIRSVTECSVSQRGNMLVIGVSGNGFLWNQIRIMAGTLVDVGLGTYRPEDVKHMLAAKDRRLSGSTAPPQGLYLQWIHHNRSEAERKPWTGVKEPMDVE